MWILGWTAHALIEQPLELFQGNIFHPAPDALASSEHLLGLLPVSGPTFWISGNAVLTYNLTTLAVVWAAAFTTFLLVRAWSGLATAGFLAGALFALGGDIPLSFLRLHSSALHLYPLVLLLAWRAAEAPRVPTLIALTVIAAIQALSGIYVAFGLGALCAAALPTIVRHARRNGHSGIAPVAALALGAAPLGLVASAYLRVQARGLLPDPAESLAVVTRASSSAATLLGRIAEELTVAGVVLAVLGGFFRRAPVGARACLFSVAGVGFVLALGTRATLPGSELPSVYEILMRVVPGFAGMRAPGRFLYLTQLALAALAGLGAAGLVEACTARWNETGRRATLALILILAIALVPARAERWPLPLSADPLAGIYVGSHRWLASHGTPGPVLDLPARTSPLDGRALLSTGRAMVGSTLHWFPLINGYSGHPPASQTLAMVLAQRLPEPQALADLCRLTQLRWIVVHHGLMPGREAAWERAEGSLPITLAVRRGRDAIYEVQCPPGAEAAGEAPAALPSSARQARLDFAVPDAGPSELVRIWTDVTNVSNRRWSGVHPLGEGVVATQIRWHDVESGVLVSETPLSPLGWDLEPGERGTVLFETLSPPPGEYTLELVVRQPGEPPFTIHGPSARRPVRIPPGADGDQTTGTGTRRKAAIPTR